MPTFTIDQQRAIDLEGRNIIVSAGAGSGKTAVLSERVIRKLKSGVSIDQLLILTFTNEAANEMKERIRKKIEKDSTLSDQLDRIDSAYITTFDSFSLSMVKKYHYLLNVSKEISILDSSIVNIKKREFIDELFDQFYEQQDEKFLKLINDFCVKDDENIRNVVYNLNNEFDKCINKEKFLTEYVDKYFSSAYFDMVISAYQQEIRKIILTINAYLGQLSSCIENDKDEEKYQEIESIFTPFMETYEYQEIKNLCNKNFKLLGKLSDSFKETAKFIKEYYKELKEFVKADSIEEIKENILLTKDYVEIILCLIKKLNDRLLQYKKENDSYEFYDIALMAIQLLEKHPEVCEEIKQYYNEILLDEYQDTSDLQEKFMSLIENNNLYMVGDIKQSIYRFRNANPLIFKNKYDTYSHLEKGIKIDLVKNFRSREEVLDDINRIFNLIMDESIGGVDYKKEHQMQYGLTLYQQENVNHDHHLEIYNYQTSDQTYTKEEMEAFIIGSDIKKKLKEGYLVFDKETSKVRKAIYSDFCIIMDRGTAFTTYKKIFEYLEIPLVLYMDQKLTDEKDILVIKNLVNIIIKIQKQEIDQEFKYYFTSIARSYLSDLSDQEIFTIFKNNTFRESEIYLKCFEISKKLDEIGNVDLLEQIIDRFEIYERTIRVGNLEDHFVRLDSLKSIASALETLGYSPIEFCDYLNKMEKSDNDIKYSLNHKMGNQVKIMNIHKSKGLEFPICYFSGFHKKFNFKDVQDRFLYDNTYGIIMPYYKNGLRKTVLHTLAQKKYYRDEISEKIRLFYVALTRAREKMIVVTSLKETDKKPVTNAVKEKYRSFLDILQSIQDTLDPYIKNVVLEDIPLTKKYDLAKEIDLTSLSEKQSDALQLKELDLSKEILSTSSVSKTIHEILSAFDSKKLEFGTKLHYLFEIADFKNLDFKSKDENWQYIQRFVAHLGDLTCAQIYKEYPFKYSVDHTIYSGIIDLIIVYEDHIKIIDYKLKNIEDENYIKQLNVYRDFIHTKTDKRIEIYLYSILEDRFYKIEKKL